MANLYALQFEKLLDISQRFSSEIELHCRSDYLWRGSHSLKAQVDREVVTTISTEIDLQITMFGVSFSVFYYVGRTTIATNLSIYLRYDPTD